jgi:hypothetical protein
MEHRYRCSFTGKLSIMDIDTKAFCKVIRCISYTLEKEGGIKGKDGYILIGCYTGAKIILLHVQLINSFWHFHYLSG